MPRDMQKNTLPEMDLLDDEEMVVYVEDVDEVIETSDEAEPSNEEDDESDIPVQTRYHIPERDDAICIFDGHKGGSVFCGSLTKNGEKAVTGGQDEKAYVWNTTTGETLFECIYHKDSVIFCGFSVKELYLATCDMSGVINIWHDHYKVPILGHNVGDVTWVKWHHSACVLLAGSVSGEVFMWGVPEGSFRILQGCGCRAEMGVISADGRRVVVGYENGTIRIMDLKTSNLLFTISPNVGHSSTITTLDCHTDNNLLLSAAVDGKTLLITLHTGKVVSILQDLNANNSMNTEEEMGSSNERFRNWVETAAFCKDPTLSVAATGTVHGDLFIWDIPKKIMRHKIQQDRGISKLVWKGNTSILFAAGLDGVLRCIDARAGRCLQSFLGHVMDIIDLYISEDGKKALTTSDDGSARIFDISSLC